MAQIIINNKTYEGKTFAVLGNNITIDDQIIINDDKQIDVKITGNVEKVIVNAGRVSVEGDVEKITTTSGDVTVAKDVHGNIQTVSGDVKASVISGKIQTVSGDIKTVRK